MSALIEEILSSRIPARIEDKDGVYRHAGVLLPLMVEDGICHVLFTERTHTVEHHKGQISLPGGGVEDKDASFGETAVREAQEEIGLSPADLDMLGRLDDTLTLVSNYVIHPFVGRIRPKTGFVLNCHEVERIIRVPLKVFLALNDEGMDQWVEYEGARYRTKAYRYKGDVIWGATARIMENFGEIMGPNFPLHSAE